MRSPARSPAGRAAAAPDTVEEEKRAATPAADSVREAELAEEMERRLGGEWLASKCTQFDKCVLAASNAARLAFRLLDFHGGVADLHAHMLRSPYPRDRSLSEVWNEVFRTSEEERLAWRLGLDARKVSVKAR